MNTTRNTIDYCCRIEQSDWDIFLMTIELTNVKISDVAKIAYNWDGGRPFFTVCEGRVCSSHKEVGNLTTLNEFILKILECFEIRETITRTEAEQLIKKRIID